MKKFLIIGNTGACIYKEIFPYIQNDKLWIGATNYNVGMHFLLPDSYTQYKYIDENGRKVGRVSTSCWWTNIDNKRRNEKIDLFKRYSNEYLHYSNCDAIDVKTYTDIPADYDGVMGVPITFLGHYNPAQFEIVGCCEPAIELSKLKTRKDFKEYKSRQILVNGILCQKTYHRFLIKIRK